MGEFCQLLNTYQKSRSLYVEVHFDDPNAERVQENGMTPLLRRLHIVFLRRIVTLEINFTQEDACINLG